MKEYMISEKSNGLFDLYINQDGILNSIKNLDYDQMDAIRTVLEKDCFIER